MRLIVDVPKKPGALAALTRRVADLRTNVLEIDHDRAFALPAVGWTRVQLTLETRGPDHVSKIEDQLQGEGYRVRHRAR